MKTRKSAKVISRCRGWSDGGRAESTGGIDVNVHGVCTCTQHARCADSFGKCKMLFAHGGTWGADRTLAALMKEAGKAIPRSWRWRNGLMWHNHSLGTYKARQDAMEGFERKFFNKCKPVIVEVRKR